jgi:hypothetical protein
MVTQLSAAFFTFLMGDSQSEYVASTQLCNPIKHLPHPLIFARKRPARNQDFSKSLTAHTLTVAQQHTIQLTAYCAAQMFINH